MCQVLHKEIERSQPIEDQHFNKGIQNFAAEARANIYVSSTGMIKTKE